jgi:alkylation response protein AidB-like acyl-CoA dehydrogenase
VRGLLARRSDPRAAIETPQGYDRGLWSVLCEQIGVAALAIPEKYGGVGAAPGDVAVAMEELGRALTPAPMLSCVLCANAVLATGNPEACARLLPAIADGSRIAALAWAGEKGWSSPACTATFSASPSAGARIDGTAWYVLDGDIADVLLVVADTADGAGLFEVGATEVRRRRTPGMDPTRRLATIGFSGASAVRLDRGGFPVERLRECAFTALSAEQVGVASRALELTVEYSRQRRQFGQPIGSFQALKHRMADVYVRVEAARSAADAALRSGSGTDAAVAKIVCSEAAEFATAEMIQLHGGIAITWEHDAHLFFKRAHGSAQLFGSVPEVIAAYEWLS